MLSNCVAVSFFTFLYIVSNTYLSSASKYAVYASSYLFSNSSFFSTGAFSAFNVSYVFINTFLFIEIFKLLNPICVGIKNFVNVFVNLLKNVLSVATTLKLLSSIVYHTFLFRIL